MRGARVTLHKCFAATLVTSSLLFLYRIAHPYEPIKSSKPKVKIDEGQILSSKVKHKTDHDLCVSSKHHSDKHLSVMLKFFNSNKSAVVNFIQDYTSQYPNYHSSKFSGYYNTNKVYKDYPTVAIRTGMSQDLIERLKHEIRKTLKMHEQIAGMVEKLTFKSTVYNPFSLQFENSILFTPSAVEFYQFMEETVYAHFPEIKGIMFEGLIVKAGSTALGTHNARNAAVNYPVPFKEKLLMPEMQKSFWVTLTESSYSTQPLMIFEDAVAETPSIAYMYKTIKQHSKIFSLENLQAIDAAFYRYTSNATPHAEKVIANFYIHAMYLQSKYCDAEKIYGYYWELQPGEGIVFNNYKIHGDGTLPPSNVDRITVALRAFSTTKTYEETLGKPHSLLQKAIDENEEQRLCVLKIFGYEDKKDFLQTLYGENYNGTLLDMPFAALLTDIGMGYSGMYKGSERMDILTLPEGLKRHYERSKDFFQSEEYVLNEDAKQCIETYYHNAQKRDNSNGYFYGHTLGDVVSYVAYKASNLVGYNREVQNDFVEN